MFIAWLKRVLPVSGGAGRTIINNTFWLAAAEFISRLAKVFLLIVAGRGLGATDYGLFSFALAFVGLFVFVADFGLNEIFVREFARADDNGREFSALFTLKLVLGLLALTLIIGCAFLVSGDSAVWPTIWLLGLMV